MLVLSPSLMAGDIPLVIKALAATRCVRSEGTKLKKPAPGTVREPKKYS